MYLQIKLLDGQTMEFDVQQDTCVIGRSSKCDVVIPLEGMSRKHCLLEVKNGEIFVTDLDSLNGVFIEEKRIPPGTPTAWPTFLSLSFGVVQSLTIDLVGKNANPSLATPKRSSVHSDLTQTKTVNIPHSSKKQKSAKSDLNRKFIVFGLFFLFLMVGYIVFKEMNSTQELDSPEEIYGDY